MIDEKFFVGYSAPGLDQRSSLSANVYANWFQMRCPLPGRNCARRQCRVFPHPTDRLAPPPQWGSTIEREEPFIDQWGASALVGLR
ncbi:hypothetical protein [Novosphingobium sp. Gsoil 351]|uniref:hypothetical protein n=1 Tax=Novosphingobium sp. Gsoil 351 TaxID=2675225 RepID=UPI0012B4FCAD|nr:hypothetical protein [Novosphingobium sp. Gsoil 351]QGN56206.1 hypothetical protein GKE62_18355 [Novosphingobium sp. Gsoil 351]